MEKRKEIKPMSIVLFVLLVSIVVIILIILLGERDLSKEEFVRNAEDIVFKSNLDIINHFFKDQFIYDIEDGKVNAMNKQYEKGIYGQVVYNEDGLVYYLIFNEKWCMKKDKTMTVAELMDFEVKTCTIEK